MVTTAEFALHMGTSILTNFLLLQNFEKCGGRKLLLEQAMSSLCSIFIHSSYSQQENTDWCCQHFFCSHIYFNPMTLEVPDVVAFAYEILLFIFADCTAKIAEKKQEEVLSPQDTSKGPQVDLTSNPDYEQLAP